MLTELRILNFALIDQLHLEFSQGFQVLTGETGAGKSLLVDALALLVGGRASTDQVRSEKEEAVLEAAFSLPANSPILERLRELDLLPADGHEFLIRRILSRTGRNRTYLNGSLTPLHTVQELAGFVIDIHGQHEQQSLLSWHAQLDMLDGFGQLKHIRDQYQQHFLEWRTQAQVLENAKAKASERHQREEFLRHQCQELEGANLSADEEETLLREHHRLQHAGRLYELANRAHHLLYEDEQSILENLRTVGDCLGELATIGPDWQSWREGYEGATVQLRELADALRGYGQDFEHDPDRLAQIDERLSHLQRLKKKYKGTLDDLIARIQELKQELEDLINLEEHIQELERRLSAEQRELESLADQLSKKRKKAASELERRIQEELIALKMEQFQFRVQVSPLSEESKLGPNGSDRVEYVISANEGEPLQPLARVASGGELSRLMLAIKTILADVDQVPVLIFDEVDTGVGGAVATVMGQRLRALGQYHQVFCITHLPQIASQAEAHFIVEKEVVKKRTVTRVGQLTQAERQEEIARMLGGLEITKAVRETASEMIEGT